MRYFITGLLLWLSSFAAMGQAKETGDRSSVLLIPYHRFEFHTQFTLEEIAHINDTIKASEVYHLFRSALVKEFASTPSSCRYAVPMTSEISYFWKRTDYEYSKEPIPHFRAFPQDVPDEKYKALLKKYDCDYVLFINWYHIEKDVYHMSGGATKSRQKYSRHYIDYDIYDAEKKLVAYEGRKVIEGKVLSKQMIFRKKLKVSDFSYQYQNLAREICEALKEGIEKSKK